VSSAFFCLLKSWLGITVHSFIIVSLGWKSFKSTGSEW
jgi:hypothetical protein